MLWRLFFASVKVNHRSVYSCILAKVCAFAMATELVKADYLQFISTKKKKKKNVLVKKLRKRNKWH